MKKRMKILCMIISVVLSSNVIMEPLMAADINIDNEVLVQEDADTPEEVSVPDETVEEETTEEVISEEAAAEESKLADISDKKSGVEEALKKALASGVALTKAYAAATKAVAEHQENGDLKVSWNVKEKDFTGTYKVSVYADKEKAELLSEKEVAVKNEEVSVELKNLSTGTVYYVSVVPYNEKGIAGQELKWEVKIPKAPEGLTTVSGDAKVSVKWNAVDGATAYEVYDADTNKLIVQTKETSFEHDELQNNVVYKYNVRAVKESDVLTLVSSYSKTVAAEKTKIVTPEVPTGVKSEPIDLGAKLTWNAAEGATSYEVYRYDSSAKTWKYLAAVKSGTTYSHTGLKSGSTWKYAIKSVRTSGGVTATSDLSKSVTQEIASYVSGAIRPMYYKATVKAKTDIYSAKSLSSKVGTLSSGTKVTVLTHENKVSGVGLVQVQVSNGKKYWIRKSKLNYTGSVYTTKDWTKQQKLDFVNKGGYSSTSKYLIWISTYTQRVNIYQGSKGNWDLIRTCRVATGKHSTYTPRGTYKITYKETGWYYATTCVKKIVHFAGRNSFHSRIYKYNGQLSDATIGKPASHGCVRMYMEDINFIYDKMPKGTTVVSY